MYEGVKVVCSKYRPPNSTNDFFEKLVSTIDNIQVVSINGYQGIIFVGDFNINWNEQDSRNKNKLSHIFNAMDITQCVLDITRPRIDNPTEGTIIDLVFANRPELCKSVNVTPNCVESDHNAVSIILQVFQPQPPKSVIQKFLCYGKGDYDRFKHSIAYCSLEFVHG